MLVRRPFLLLLSLTAACAGAADKNGEGNTDDTAGGDGGGPDYEEGCITVDGEGGYAWINDAIAVAEAGATIQLCAESTHEEAVIVDKAVNIVGPGADTFILVPPVNTDGFTISAAGATVSGVAVSSTRSGFSVSANDVTLSGISVVTAGNWGVEAADLTGLLIEDSTLLGNGYGGLKVDSAEATLRASVLDANVSYGAFVTGGGSLTVDTSEVKNTALDANDDSDDGSGVYAEEASEIISIGSTYTTNSFVNVYALGADLSMSGDTITGGLYGAVATDGAVSYENVTVTNSAYLGLLGSTIQPIVVSGVTVTGGPDDTIDIADDDWGSRSVGFIGSGLLLGGDDITVTDTSVTGYNDAGLVLLPYSDDGERTATVERVTLTDNGRHGAYVNGVTLTATDLVVSGVIEKEDQGDNRCLTVDKYGAVILVANQASFTGGSITANQGYGISAVQATMTVDGTAFSANVCAAVMNFQGGANITGADFSQAGPDALNASVVDYQSVGGTYLYNNTFHDSQTETDQVTEYTDGTYIYTYIYRAKSGVDIYISEGAGAEIIGNTFINGTTGIIAYGANTVLEDNTFTDYAYYPVAASAGSMDMAHNTIDGFGGYGIQCSQANMSIQDTTVTNGGDWSYHYEYYTDGVLNYSFDSSYSGYALYAYDCAMTMEDSDFSTVNGPGGYIYASSAGSYEFDNVSFTDVAQAGSGAGLNFYLYNPNSAVYLTDVTVSGVPSGTGVYTYANMAAGSYAYLVADGLEIDDVGSQGMSLSGSPLDVTLTNATISATASYGIFTSGIANFNLTNSSVTSAGASGVYVSATTATLTGNTITGNTYYGMECTVTSLDACYGNDLSGNALGEHNGCDDECSSI